MDIFLKVSRDKVFEIVKCLKELYKFVFDRGVCFVFGIDILSSDIVLLLCYGNNVNELVYVVELGMILL